MSEAESLPPTKPICGCSLDVSPDWLTAVEGETKLGMNEAIELLEQSEGFESVCENTPGSP